MLRRGLTTSPLCAAAAQRRHLSNKADELARMGAPTPPMIPEDPVVPMDFNPHIEWFEFPKECWDPRYPYTREECIRFQDERWDSTQDEMSEKYGMRIIPPPKLTFWLAYLMTCFYVTQFLYGMYRAQPGHPTYPDWRRRVEASPNCPTIAEDEEYLDQWMVPGFRQTKAKMDPLWAWKPIVKRHGVDNPMAIPLQQMDVSEWKHMTSN
jgi:hypothetical protein